jgi:hypothetical protein
VSAGGGFLRGRVGLALRYGITLALIAWIVGTGDWHRMRQALLAVRPGDFFLSYLLLLAAWGVVVARLRVLLEWTPIRRRWIRLYRIQLVSHFIGFVAPSDIGMAVARWFLVTENRTGRGAFLLVTLQERLLMMATAAGLCLAGLWMSNTALADGLAGRLCVLLLAVLGASLAALALLSRGVSAGWGQRGYRRLARLAGFGSAAGSRDPDRPGPDVAWGRLLGRAALLTVLFLALSVLNVGVLARALGAGISGCDLLWMVTGVMLFLVLPFSVGGIGLRELGYGTLFHWVGADAAAGVALGLLLSVQILLNALLGGLLSLHAPGPAPGKGVPGPPGGAPAPGGKR